MLTYVLLTLTVCVAPEFTRKTVGIIRPLYLLANFQTFSSFTCFYLVAYIAKMLAGVEVYSWLHRNAVIYTHTQKKWLKECM